MRGMDGCPFPPRSRRPTLLQRCTSLTLFMIARIRASNKHKLQGMAKIGSAKQKILLLKSPIALMRVQERLRHSLLLFPSKGSCLIIHFPKELECLSSQLREEKMVHPGKPKARFPPLIYWVQRLQSIEEAPPVKGKGESLFQSPEGRRQLNYGKVLRGQSSQMGCARSFMENVSINENERNQR